MFYSGAHMVTRGHSFRAYDWDKAVGLVDRLMASYGLSGADEKTNKMHFIA
jgi:4-hydroxyphenylacetate 3-monooxygenase